MNTVKAVKASCTLQQSPTSHSTKPELALHLRRIGFDDEQKRRNCWNSKRNTDSRASRPFSFFDKGNRLDIREDGKLSSGASTPMSQYSDNASYSSTSYMTVSPKQESIISQKEGRDVLAQFEDALNKNYNHDKNFIEIMENEKLPFLMKNPSRGKLPAPAGSKWCRHFLKMEVCPWREKCVFAHHPTEFHPMACDEDEDCRHRCCEYLHSDESKEKDGLFVGIQLRQMYNILHGRKKSNTMSADDIKIPLGAFGW
eukprot:CAMPEP_0185254176 /NCGR_PEP_ID=MMETSP1359-20130426/2866_1 /TAXON_ID=552665 /ORGANISM="Bigelowiella longifila, Strain CCMP242" /LENGTH=255 /DNA_ID=CAMNT_0027836889 /DNA_START=44 /DNA_END=809 /DNA_ORIENTATION=-